MVVNIALYEKNKYHAADWYKRTKDIHRTIGMVSSITMVPAIVVAYWVGELTNWSEESLKAIRSIKNFYDYSEIQNKPEGAPE